MIGNVWKSSIKQGRVPSKNRSSEIARVIVLSFLLAILFQIPMVAYNHAKVSIIRSVGPEEAAAMEQTDEVPAAVQQQSFQPTSIAHYAFVKFSSYRVSLKTFYVVGISSIVVRDRDKKQVVHSCEWHPQKPNGSKAVHSDPKDFVVANASMLYARLEEENLMTYAPAIANCTFHEDIGADGNGGLLVIRVSTTYNRWKKNVPVIVHDEQPGDVEIFVRPPKEKPHKYAYCGAPMHDYVKADWVKAWLVYHNYLWNGDALYFFYNVGGLLDDERHHFKEFIDAGLLNITDLTNPHIKSLYPSWNYHQLLYINDCLNRARFLADYIFFFDFDEFLQIRAPETIESLLEKHKDLPWLSVGSFPADLDHCTPATNLRQQYTVERMVWRNKMPQCRHDDEDPWVCLAFPGHRKWVANTRHTVVGSVHRAAVPFKGGVDVNASLARVIHFHNALKSGHVLCNIEEKDDNPKLVKNNERDEAIAQVFAQAKLFPIKRKFG